jgi:PAS domain S-box-containing protein
LIVEDHPEQAELVTHELAGAGFAPTWAIASDSEGCRSAVEEGVDLVVADCNTVEIGLPELMALLGELGDPPPVVCLSTDDSEEVARECLRHGASAFLHKFRLDRIGELVRGLIENRGPRHAAAIGSGLVDLRRLAEHACDLIAEISADGRLLYVNPSVELSLGYAVDELVGRRAFEFVHPEDLPATLESLRKTIETGSASRGAHRVRHRDGSWRRFESTANPYRTAEGERRVIAISREITERFQPDHPLRDVGTQPDRLDLQQLEALVPSLDEIANGLGSLLTAIATEAESVERQLDSSSWLRRDMDRIVTSVEGAAALVRLLAELCTDLAGESRISDTSRADPETGPRTILLVENEDRLRSVIRETLEEEGYAVVEAAGGEEALEKAQRHSGPIHLLLSEAALPGIDGRELARRVRASSTGARVVLMVDVADDGEPPSEGVRSPTLLRKPFTLAALRAELDEVLGEDPDRDQSG